MRLHLTLLIFFSSIINLMCQDWVCKHIEDIAESERLHHSELLRGGNHGLSLNYDIHYNEMKWQVDPSVTFIEGTVKTAFTALEDMEQIVFDFEDNMVIDEITQDGESLNYDLADGLLTITFASPVKADEIEEITIRYKGNPSNSGLGAFETTDQFGFPVLWTLSEPYGARSWWPCKQDLNDKIDSIDVIVTVPTGNKVASNGILLSEVQDNEKNMTTFHWQHKYPIAAYLIAIAVAPYEVFSDWVVSENGDSLEVLNYIYPGYMDQAQNLELTVDYINLFDSLFGTYPYMDEKYGHAQFGWGGGMEHQTMSFMGGFHEDLQAHELAHQWFGNKVTCGTWEDIWLNEGFATFLTGLKYEFRSTDYWHNRFWEVNLSSITSHPSGSVFVQDTTDIYRIFSSRLSYKKGAYLLRMLRWQMGDNAFFTACRNYLEDPALAYGYSQVEDFIKHAESVTDKNIQLFFNDWYYGEGYPTYHATWHHGEEPPALINSEEKIKIYLEQSTSHPSVDFYSMKVPILLKGIDQDSTIVLDHEFSGQEFLISTSFYVEDIEIDPELKLVSAGNTVIQLTDVKNIQEHASISFNNPVNEQLSLSIHEPLAKVELISPTGELIYSLKTTGLDHMDIDMTDIQPGFYLLRALTGKGKSHSFKVLKL